MATGFAVQSVGFAIAMLLGVDSSYWLLLTAVAPMAAGMALLMPPTTNAIVSALPQDKAGVASAVNDTTREVGGAVGIAMMGTLVTVSYQSAMSGAAEGLPQPLAELAEDSIGGAARAATQLDPGVAAPLLEQANTAFVDGTTIAFGAAVALGLIMTAVIGRFYPDDEPAIDEAALVG